MKSYKIISLICAAGILLISQSCKKGDDDVDTSTPVVTITKPTASQVFNAGDTVWIAGNVSDNELHEMVVEIKDNAKDSVFYTESISVHDMTTYDYLTFWTGRVSVLTNATVTVKAEDHKGHVGTATRNIQIKP